MTVLYRAEKENGLKISWCPFPGAESIEVFTLSDIAEKIEKKNHGIDAKAWIEDLIREATESNYPATDTEFEETPLCADDLKLDTIYYYRECEYDPETESYWDCYRHGQNDGFYCLGTSAYPFDKSSDRLN